ncbi:Large proline-rich protein BAT2 [Operophtera brumata]|uniref:Large proline-rich protein BAT2 n=1 Tax=Operophtera brumata TaxID=104452 RepID=A0A0L7KJ90_OPEBR|nr:Large proline-rich protein BAT2 [Operophtera brumata]
MSALSTPGGGGNTAQSKPTSGKQKYQKLDINSLYCANRNENLEPSSVKSQLSRKHGMQSLGKVPSTRRPPANLPSLKTETGQDPNAK